MKKRLCIIALILVLCMSLSSCLALLPAGGLRDQTAQKVPAPDSREEKEDPVGLFTETEEVSTSEILMPAETEEMSATREILSPEGVVFPKPGYKLMSIYQDDVYVLESASIEFVDHESFVMNVNLYEGFGQMKGTYTWEENSDGTVSRIQCSVREKNFTGFVGDSMTLFHLTAEADGSFSVALQGVDFVGTLDDGDLFWELER